MNKLISNSLEILFSLFIVCGLLFIAFYIKPTATVEKYEPTLFGYRDNYYSVASPLADGTVIWAVGNKGKIIRSDDASKTWRIQKTPTTSHLQDIATWNEKSAIVAGDLASVLITDSAGENWEKVEVPTYEFGDQLLQVFIDQGKQQAWISGTMGTVLKSIDKGHSWQMAHEQEDVAWNDIIVDPKGRLWVAGEFGRLQRSADEGASWEEVEAPTEGSSLMSIAFANENQGVAVGLSGTVVRTDNGGDDWSVVGNVTSAHLFDIHWDGQQYVAVGNNGILARGSVDGTGWKVSKIHPDNSGWYTCVIPVTNSYYIAGVNLGVLTGTDWKVFP